MKKTLLGLCLLSVLAKMGWAADQGVVHAAPEPLAVGIKLFSALSVLVAVLLVAFYVVKRFFLQEGLGGGREGFVTVLATRYFGPKTGIAVIRIGRECFVLGISASHVSLVAKLADDLAEGEDDQEGGGFSLLEQVRSISEKYGRKWGYPSSLPGGT